MPILIFGDFNLAFTGTSIFCPENSAKERLLVVSTNLPEKWTANCR